MTNQQHKICMLPLILSVFILRTHASEGQPWWTQCKHDLSDGVISPTSDLACKSAGGCCGDIHSDSCPPPMTWESAWMCAGGDTRK